MSLAASTIAQNLDTVRERIAGACDRAGRSPSDVRLVAITKSVGIEEIRSLVELGVMDIGENRPLELARRAQDAADLEAARWHLVGHFQRNKIRKTLPYVTWLHSVDSVRLVQTLGTEVRRLAEVSGEKASAPSILVEVNVASEPQKTGMDAAEFENVLAACRDESLSVRGLMTMAPLGSSRDQLRPVFSGLRELRDRAVERGWAEALPELSMGMTNDFEEAIEEGATMVRIGRALFRESCGS